MNPDWPASASSSSWLRLLMGKALLGNTSNFVHHHPDCHDMFTQVSRSDPSEISASHLSAAFPCSLATTVLPSVERIRAMKNEKLKSTTVRFTDSDLDLIECLQEKLGLGMIHVIRLAIRRMAESENLLPSPSIPEKRQRRTLKPD